MNPDILLLVSVWDTVKHYVPKKDRVEAAEHLVRVFDEEADLGNIEDEVGTFDAVLKTAVTGKVKPGSKSANRRKSYCARSAGQLRNSSTKTQNDPNSRIRQARRRWKC